MVQANPVRVVAVIVPLLLWGVFAAAPLALGQEREAEIKIQTQETPDARQNQPHPPVAGQDAAVYVDVDTAGEDRELKVDFDAKGFADVLAVIRQMRMEIVQLRRELAEARGDRPLAERRLGYRQDGELRNGERVENRIDNRQGRRSQRIDNRGERRDQRAENRDDRPAEAADADRDRGDRRDNRQDRRDDRQDDRQEDRQEDREERRDDRQDDAANDAKVEVEVKPADQP